VTINQIPQRQRGSRPSPKAQAVAARVRVNADRRAGVKTPQWIVTLSQTPAARYVPFSPGQRARNGLDVFFECMLHAPGRL
jgi:hypothetical protein